jgi:eukaryotic-like serine/threonine-protein kinase
MEQKESTDPSRDAAHSAEPSLAEGAILNRRFRIERVVGKGGMGHVLSAMHLELDQRVAIKLILPGRESDRRGTQRLLREARAAARIKSEHVVRVLDVVSAGETPAYIVMEYLEGEDLAGRLSRRGWLGIEETVSLIVQACEAVGEAHQRGIVHRDLKPSNLFLIDNAGRADFVKVLDFGISKLDDRTSDSLTQSHALLGSPMYSAPEQLRSSHDVDLTADIWSLGVILYECAAGKRPFTGQTLGQLCTQILEAKPTPLGKLRRDLPDGFERIVMRCLEKEPSRRYQSVAELVSALRAFQPVSAAACLGYLASVRGSQSSATRAVERRAAVASGTLTDSIEYDTELPVDRSGGGRARATLVFWSAGLAIAVAGSWLLGRASNSGAPLSSSSPSVPIKLPNHPHPTPLESAASPSPSSPPASEPGPSTASPRPTASIRSAKIKRPRSDSRAATRETDVPWVESR